MCGGLLLGSGILDLPQGSQKPTLVLHQISIDTQTQFFVPHMETQKILTKHVSRSNSGAKKGSLYYIFVGNVPWYMNMVISQ